MYIEGEKIKSLISIYGKSQEYPEKSYTAMFCKDFDLNYNQWNAYTRGAQVVGNKITLKLMDIFPDLNLNWLLKDEKNMFSGSENVPVIKEPAPKPAKKIEKQDIYDKLDDILIELKKVTSKEV
jgi:hypothetical protein